MSWQAGRVAITQAQNWAVRMGKGKDRSNLGQTLSTSMSTRRVLTQTFGRRAKQCGSKLDVAQISAHLE